MKHKIFILPVVLIAFVAVALCWLLASPFVGNGARIAAIAAMQDKLGSVPQKGTLIIVDFSQPSQTKRLAVMNIGTGRMLFHARVAHGEKSGGVYALNLSNTTGSLKSSAGLFSVAEAFNGKHGKSLRLIGLSPQLNSNAEKRGIIIHSGEYVSLKSVMVNWKEGFRLGRSQGCFVLSNGDFQELNKSLVRPAYLYSYTDDGKPR